MKACALLPFANPVRGSRPLARSARARVWKIPVIVFAALVIAACECFRQCVSAAERAGAVPAVVDGKPQNLAVGRVLG